GLVHRDIKPGNIMLCANGAVRILDFGLCAKAGDLTLAGPDAPIGTLDFMSPEQGLCAPPDPRMDLYSLGCTYYFALTGQPPFFSVRDDQIPLMHQYSPIPDVRVARREVRRAAAELISRLMAKDPKDRPSSAAELLHALNSDELSTPMESPIILLAPMAEKKPVVESDPASPAAESSAAPVALPSPLFVPPAPVARRNPLAAKLVAGTAFLLVFGRHWRGPGSADWAAAALFASGAVAYLFFQIDLAVFRRRASSFLGCAVVVLCAWFYGAAGLSRGLPLDVLVLAGVGMVAIGASLFVGLWNEAKSDLFVAAGLVVAGAAMLILAAASQSLPEATPWVSAISARLRGDWAIFVSSGGLWRWSGLLVLGLAWRMRRRRASGRPAWDRMIVNWNR
ncbi:MAG TPA: hypothetical protein DEB40_08265, partial [Elusimicrobia bacterium]|nr:hypothetical protein [Elusimicrobiota bacterium]